MKPNILYLITHDTGRFPGCYRRPIPFPSNLDRFAAHGIQFNHAFCSAPCCGPVRNCAMTGQNSHVTGTLQLRVATCSRVVRRPASCWLRTHGGALPPDFTGRTALANVLHDNIRTVAETPGTTSVRRQQTPCGQTGGNVDSAPELMTDESRQRKR